MSKYEQLCEALQEIDFEKGLEHCGGIEELYMEVLQEFSESTIKEQLDKHLGEGDYVNYRIKIHGFKNNAYTVGAKDLGDLAYQMECSSREGFAEGIREMQSNLVEKYNRIKSIYNQIMDNN